MSRALSTGLNFGLCSGVITTLGLIVGLHAGTESQLAVIGGIVTIAVADSFSDALGIHLAQESDANATRRDIWEATLATLVAKMGMALTFLVPVLLLDAQAGIIASVAWGLLVITVISVVLARRQQQPPLPAVLEHLAIAALVILVTYGVGVWVAEAFA